jgi:hypothetical protein
VAIDDKQQRSIAMRFPATTCVLYAAVMMIGVSGWDKVVPVRGGKIPAWLQSSAVVDQVGGWGSDILRLQSEILVGSGPRVIGFSVAPDLKLARVAQTPILPGVVRALAEVPGGAAVALGSGGLCLLEIDPGALRLSTCVTTTGPVLDVAADEQWIALARGRLGVSVYRIAGTTMQLTDEIQLQDSVTAIAITRGYVLAMVARGFTVISLGPTGLLAWTGDYDIGVPVSASALAVQGERVLLGVGPQLLDISLSDPREPALRSVLSLVAHRGGEVADIHVESNVAYVAMYAERGEDGGIWAVDIRDMLRVIDYPLANDFITAVEVVPVDVRTRFLLCVMDGALVGSLILVEGEPRRLESVPLGTRAEEVDVATDEVLASGLGGVNVLRSEDLTELWRYSRRAEDAVGFRLGDGSSRYVVAKSPVGDSLQYAIISVVVGADGPLELARLASWEVYNDITVVGNEVYVAAQAQGRYGHGAILRLSMNDDGSLVQREAVPVGGRGAVRVRSNNGAVAYVTDSSEFGVVYGGKVISTTVTEGSVTDAVVHGESVLVAATTADASGGSIVRYRLAEDRLRRECVTALGRPAVSLAVLDNDHVVVGTGASTEDETYGLEDSATIYVVNTTECSLERGGMQLAGYPHSIRLSGRRVLVAAGIGGLYSVDVEWLIGDRTATPVIPPTRVWPTADSTASVTTTPVVTPTGARPTATTPSGPSREEVVLPWLSCRNSR